MKKEMFNLKSVGKDFNR